MSTDSAQPLLLVFPRRALCARTILATLIVSLTWQCRVTADTPPIRKVTPHIWNRPSFSFDGRYVALLVFGPRGQISNRNEARVLDATTWLPVEVHLPEYKLVGEIVWRPNTHDFVTYIIPSGQNASARYLLYGVEAGRPSAITIPYSCMGPLEWSLDGTQLLTTLATDNARLHVNAFLLPVGSRTSGVQISHFKCVRNKAIAWDRDGETILVAPGSDSAVDPDGGAGVYRVGIDGAAKERITELNYVEELVPSPDGRWLALTTGNDFVVLNRANGKVHRVDRVHLPELVHASWRPDSGALGYCANERIRIWFPSKPSKQSSPIAEHPEVRKPFWNPKDQSLWGVKSRTTLVRFDGKEWQPLYTIPEA